MPSPDPSPLVVRTPGSVLVVTDELLAHLPRLARLADDLEHDAHRLAMISLRTRPGPLRSTIDGCERRMFEAAGRVRSIRAAIHTAEWGYTLAERTATGLTDIASDWAVASLSRPFAAFVLPWLLTGAAAAWGLAPGSDEQKAKALERFMLEHPELITSPEFSALVRRVVAGADDAVLGGVGLPPLVLAVLGDHGLGLLGAGTSAAMLTGVGALLGTRLLNETPVRVDKVGTSTGMAPPVGAADRLARVPGEKQIRIERYSAPGEDDRYIVYVAPTQTFSPMADGDPWDLTSNIAGVGGLASGSIRATEQAMADAGISAGSEVVLVGYSQGGLVADAIAGSGRWNVAGLETYGDPGGSIALPDGIRGVAVRHTDDFVVSTGGPQPPVDRVIVERRAYPDGAVIPTDRLAPAHQKDAYAATARQLDAARSTVVRDELHHLDAFARDYSEREGAEVTTLEYRAERVSAASSAGGR
jgi:hypothetical protein